MKNFLKILGKCFAVIFTLILFVLHITTHVSFDLTSITSKDKIKSVVENFDIDKVLINEDGTKSDVYLQLEDACIDSGFTEQQTYNALHSKAAKSIIGQIGGELTETLLGNRSSLTMDRVKKIFSDNFNTLLIEINVNITEEEKLETLGYINNYIDKFFTKILIEENVIKGEKNLKHVADLLFSSQYKLILLCLVVVATGILALCKYSFIKALKTSGIITLVSSIIMLIIGICPLLLSNVLTNLVGSNAILIISIIKSLTITVIINSIIGIILGNVQIIASNYIRDLVNKKVKKES